jgi:ribosomal protein L3
MFRAPVRSAARPPSRVYRVSGGAWAARASPQNLLVVRSTKKNLIYLRGSVPGAPNAYVAIKRAKRG